MTNTKLQKLTSYIGTLYNATYLPFHLFKNGSFVQSFSSIPLTESVVKVSYNLATKSDDSYSYISTSEHLYIGIVKDKKNNIVILGPVTNVSIHEETIDKMIRNYSLPVELKPSIIEYFERTPHFSLSQFLSILALVNKEMNGEMPDFFSESDINNEPTKKKVARAHTKELYDRKENATFHDTYFFEQEYYGYVEKGDVEGLTAFIKNIPTFSEGTIASDSLRQAKNIFITSIALTTRHAISGGLDIETAYLLSDSYIQEVERMSSATAITRLNATAIIDFTKRVAESKIPSGMSKDIFKAIQYISNHVNQNITVEEVSDYLQMDRSTLSKKFKRELGFNISSYIMRKKLEEAKSLLANSDRTISEISAYLCFSTQSYFQNVFKKKYGITPKEYRESK